MYNALYRLRKKNIRVITKERVILCLENDLERIKDMRQTDILMAEYRFALKMMWVL
jgi:uncharacterized protein (DUF1786 family)